MNSIIKHITLSILFSIIIMPVTGQKINIGQQVPDVLLNNVLNYSSTQLKLSDFRRKLIILDFWGPNCISCLEEFSLLDSLQEQYKKRVQIIAVNKESKEFTEKFFEQRKQFLNPSFPLITEDTILYEFFPHRGEPFHVWIDGTGVVQYLINGYNTTAKHISGFLHGQKPKISKYTTGQTYTNTLIKDKWESSLTYYSYISHCIPHFHIGSGKPKAGFIQLSANCNSVLELYIMAFNELNKYNFNKPWKVNLEIDDTFQYMRPHNNNLLDLWRSKYSYNYDLLLPASMNDRKYKIMQQDLIRYFGLEAKIEKKNMKCWALIRTSHKDKLHTNGGIPKDNFMRSSIVSPISDSIRFFYNQPYKGFSGRLNNWIEYKFSMPFIDATGYKDNIDIKIKGTIIDSLDISDLNKALKKYDLKLIEKDQLIKILSIKERQTR